MGSAFDCGAAWGNLAKLRPDFVVMDLDVPGEGGMALTARIVHYRPGTKVVVLSAQHTAASVNNAVRAGAHGYVLKLDADHEFLPALRTVQQGRSYVIPTPFDDLIL